MVVTEPIPDRLAELGWTGGELLSDSRFTISYFRTTVDGRIAFGAGVGAAGYGGLDRTDLHPRSPRGRARRRATSTTSSRCSGTCASTTPGAGRSTSPATASPRSPRAMAARIHFAHGFAGNGAGPSRLAGRILAALVDDPHRSARAPADRRPPPAARCRPSRSASSVRGMVREALIRQDDAARRRSAPAWYLRLVAPASEAARVSDRPLIPESPPHDARNR